MAALIIFVVFVVLSIPSCIVALVAWRRSKRPVNIISGRVFPDPADPRWGQQGDTVYFEKPDVLRLTPNVRSGVRMHVGNQDIESGTLATSRYYKAIQDAIRERFLDSMKYPKAGK